MRLHELAKEIGAESKKLLALAKELGLKKVRNHSSNLAEGEMAILKAAYREDQGDAAPEPTPQEAVAVPEAATAAPRRRRRRDAGASTTDLGESEDVTEAPTEVFESDDAEFDDGDASSDDEADQDEAASVDAESSDDDDDADSVPEQEANEDPARAADLASAKATDNVTDSEPARRAPATGSQKTEKPRTADASQSQTQRVGKAPLTAAARKGGPDAGARPGRSTTPPLRPAVSTGKPEQTPTPRRRVGGAKILGRIELPQEEVNRARTRPLSPSEEAPDPDRVAGGRGIGRSLMPPTRETMEQQKARRNANRPREEMVTWSPDDEDDPLLQGIRVQNVQRGPHTRRPPRRVGPRKSGRRMRPTAPVGPVAIECPISVRALSQELGVKVRDILRAMMSKGVMDGHGEMALDEEGVIEIAATLNREVNTTQRKGKEEKFLDEVDAVQKGFAAQSEADSSAVRRAPIVAFLGHVDHGKTSLLDRIRKSNVAGGEAGGITQSMRAYSVPVNSAAGSITFLDTPGHKAFTEMRARGAHVTDIVVLVVAADDGVMPQTQEAIQHAQAANCPIVVALNKCDRPEANPDRVLQQLSQESVAVEGWGGSVQYARCSAITGDGIDELLEKIALEAEVMELRADPTREAVGTVLEAYKDDKLGAVATVLVQEGTLRPGDVILSGTAFGRARKLVDDQGRSIQEAGPSTPVNVIGFNDAPNASERFFELESLKKAREVAEERDHAERQERVSGPAPAAVTLDNLFESLEAGKAAELKIILRCDLKGSLEVIKRSLQELEQKEVRIKIIRNALGGITEDDVVLAVASQAVVIGFNVVADDKARRIAESNGVDLRTYQVIYEMFDDVKAAMEGLLSPVRKENVVGHVEIREIFKVSRIGSIAGCKVSDGMIRRNSTVRVTRNGVIVHTGGLDSLKRIKDDVREVREGLECGLHLTNFNDIKIGDILEIIEMAEERRTLDFTGS